MRSAIVVSLLLCAGMTGIALAASTVDLDAPGAMEVLARDRPVHYKRIMDEIEKAQTIYVEPVPALRDALADGRSKEGFSALLPSAPAKKRMSVVLDDIDYRFTVRMTRDPGKLEKAM